jgi:hypothetical protein
MDGLALVQRFQLRQLFGVRFQHIGQLQQNALAIGRTQAGPHARGEGTVCTLHHHIHILFVAIGHAGNHLAGSRITHLAALAGLGSHRLAIQQQAMLAQQESIHRLQYIHPIVIHFSPLLAGRPCPKAGHLICLVATVADKQQQQQRDLLQINIRVSF